MAKKKSIQDQLVVEKTDKSFDPAVQAQSVVVPADVKQALRPQTPLLFMLASAADTMVPWGADVGARDQQLRTFYPTEPVLSSAVYSVAARDASFAWEIVPSDPRENSKNTVRAVKRMLSNVGMGLGWVRFMIKTCVDIYTQDNGAFWEVIRAADSPSAPVLSLNNLDSARCVRTGDPKTPVIYQDYKGVWHELKYYHVVSIEEMPSPIETMYNAQMCAVTRVLRLAQILKSIYIYKDEKVSGRNPRAIDFVSGVGMKEIEDATKIAKELADNQGLLRFSSHVLIPGIDPENPVSHVRVDLASLPDNFSLDEEMRWYIAILAMGFGVDYQEFAPLSSGSLGSGQQSEILHLKTHGKGPALIMSLFEHILNNSGIIPSTVQFRYKAHDARTETETATARYTRGRDRALRVQSGELDVDAARYIAVQDGDIPEWVAEDMEQRGQEADPATQPPVVVPVAQDQQQSGITNTAQQIQGGQQSQMKSLMDELAEANKNSEFFFSE